MKLRNKKTGKVIEWFNNTDGVFPNTLAELNKEWEDVEGEPKTFWFLSGCGNAWKNKEDDNSEETIEKAKQIGNYFETKEEAEQSAEKLKAWKRLKDKGFRFTGYLSGDGAEVDRIYAKFPYGDDLTDKDLDLLFGGENETD